MPKKGKDCQIGLDQRCRDHDGEIRQSAGTRLSRPCGRRMGRILRRSSQRHAFGYFAQADRRRVTLEDPEGLTLRLAQRAILSGRRKAFGCPVLLPEPVRLEALNKPQYVRDSVEDETGFDLVHNLIVMGKGVVVSILLKLSKMLIELFSILREISRTLPSLSRALMYFPARLCKGASLSKAIPFWSRTNANFFIQ